MDGDHTVQVLSTLMSEVHRLYDAFKGTAPENEPLVYRRVAKLLHLLAPLLTLVIFYQYMKYLLIMNACEYEEWVKKRSGYVRKLSRQLRLLTKRHGNLYFCYLPMNHGTMLPPAISLFSAIKDILVNANRPATRVMRTNLLMDLVHGEPIEPGHMTRSSANRRRSFGSDERDFSDLTEDEGNPFSEINLNIMKCSRELIIQGVKDFDVMSTVYRVMETATRDEED